MNRVIALDFDGVLRNSATNEPIPGAKEAINILRENHNQIIIYSCNNPKFIERWMTDHDMRFDYIWLKDDGPKPIATVYVDDRGFRFTEWDENTTNTLLDFVGG